MELENNYLNFKKLLTMKDIKEFIKLEFATHKAQYLSKILKDYIMISKNELYIVNENIIYELVPLDIDQYLKTNIRYLFENSLFKLNDNERRLFEIEHKRDYEALKKENLSKDYLNDVKLLLTNNNIKFNITKSTEIHFKNGYYNLEKSTFNKRQKGKHFITKHIYRDYNEPKPESIKFIYVNIIDKIFPIEEERDYILANEIGAGLSGLSIEDQTNFFMLGIGSSGKSLFMKCIKACIECYMLELKNDSFNKGNSKQDKIFNSFLINNLIRIAWVNEMDDKKIDESLFKSFCEGVLQTVSLFVDGLNDFTHQAKLFGTMNSIPKIKIDSGSVRRIEAYNPVSEFVDDIKSVNESKHKYLKDKTILSKITSSEEYLNALFKIIADYSNIYIKDRNRFKKPNSFKEAETFIIESNDVVGNFLKDHFEITENENDMITNQEMHVLFKDLNPNSFITSSQLVSELRQRKVEYNPNLRFAGGRGKYIKIREKMEKDKVINPLDEGTPDDNETQMKKEIAELKKKLEELEKENKLLKEKQKPEIKEIEQEKKTLSLEELDAKLNNKQKTTKVKRNKSTKSEEPKEDLTKEEKQNMIKNKEVDLNDNDDDIDIELLEKDFSNFIKKNKNI